MFAIWNNDNGATHARVAEEAVDQESAGLREQRLQQTTSKVEEAKAAKDAIQLWDGLVSESSPASAGHLIGH
jgi:hypothetical protein